MDFNDNELIDEINDYIDRRIHEAEVRMHDELTNHIYKVVQNAVEENRKQILTSDEAAEYLGVTKRTLANWAKEGILPRYELGGKHYWKMKDIILSISIFAR